MKLPIINQKKIINLLLNDKRFDGRKPFEYRDLVIETNVSNNAEGSARVRMGKTDVIVGVKLGIQAPYPDHKDEGTMMVGFEFSSSAGERHEMGPPKINSIEIARVVDRGIRESGFIDWKKLCIQDGEKVWAISIDVYCINDDGNALDASALGAVAALKMARFPVYNAEEEAISYGEFTDTPLPLTDNVPFAMTFYKVGEKLLIDPTREEEDAATARLTLALSKPEKDYIINSMQKGEQDNLSEEDLKTVISESEKVYESMIPNIDNQIKKLTEK